MWSEYANWDVMKQTIGTLLRFGVRVAAIGVIAGATAGCGMSSLTSGLGTSVFGGSGDKQAQVDSVSEEQLLSAAKADFDPGGATAALGTGGVAHGCPRLEARQPDNNVTIYEQGQIGDSLAIMHRGEITKTARECMIENGRVTVKYGFSGRILLGPRGQPGPVVLPVSVIVHDAARAAVASDQAVVSVDMQVDNPIGYFSAVRTVTFDVAQGARPGEYQIDVMFDRTAPGAG